MKNTQQGALVFSCALDIVARQHRLNLPNCVLFRCRTVPHYRANLVPLLWNAEARQGRRNAALSYEEKRKFYRLHGMVRWSYRLTLRGCKTCPPLELAEHARLVRQRFALC